jgi:hypothetical protein
MLQSHLQTSLAKAKVRKQTTRSLDDIVECRVDYADPRKYRTNVAFRVRFYDGLITSFYLPEAAIRGLIFPTDGHAMPTVEQSVEDITKAS